jgi:hypothetical protein
MRNKTVGEKSNCAVLVHNARADSGMCESHSHHSSVAPRGGLCM